MALGMREAWKPGKCLGCRTKSGFIQENQCFTLPHGHDFFLCHSDTPENKLLTEQQPRELKHTVPLGKRIQPTFLELFCDVPQTLKSETAASSGDSQNVGSTLPARLCAALLTFSKSLWLLMVMFYPTPRSLSAPAAQLVLQEWGFCCHERGILSNH